MKGLVFSATQKRKHLSHYKIAQSHIIAKSTFKDSNHLETVKPGTLDGFTFKDKEGKAYQSIEEYEESKLKPKQEEKLTDEGLTL